MIRLCTHFTAAVLGLFAGYHIFDTPPPPVPTTNSTVTLIAVTPEHVKLYRINSPTAIVPVLLAVSPNGATSIR